MVISTGILSPAAPIEESPEERLANLDKKLGKLEDERKELLLEVAKEEVAESEEAHKDCAAKDEFEEAEDRAEKAEEENERIRQALQRFGGHAPDCLSGALAGTQALHPLCTCGWNDVATEVERW